jgi:thioredoxin-like negative regulator of GroEL
MSASEERVHDLLRAARRLMESGDRDQALRTLHKALDTDPDNSEVREEIQSIEREIAAMKVFKKTRSARAHAPEEATVPASGGFVDECIRRSQEAIDSGDEIRALQELERARRQDSENDEINRRIKVVKRSIKANNLADLGLTRLR